MGPNLHPPEASRHPMVILLCLLLVLLFLVVVLVFGDLPSCRNTALKKLHTRLLRVNSTVIRHVTSNNRLYSAVLWAIPSFYCIIVSVCVYEFFKYVYPQLAAVRSTPSHTVWIVVTLAAVVVFGELVTFSDPGFATSDNIDAALLRYPENGVIFFKKSCRTCHLQRPARSKHCSVCDRCVYLYDHHCPFVNNCVGHNNYRWFLAFLVANVNLMVYGGYLCWKLLSTQKWPEGLWSVITGTTLNNKVAGILMILGTIFSVVVTAFLLLHIRYMYLGVTTNEADKWGEIEHLVSIGALYYVDDLGIYVEKASMTDSSGNYTPAYIALEDEHIVFEGVDETKHVLRKIVSMEDDLDNIYDKGFVGNVRDRLRLG